MKYFPLSRTAFDKSDGVLMLTQQATQIIIEICKNLKIPLQGVHLALWLFHCQVKIMTFRKFDRFIYLCGSILVSTKMGQHLRNPADILHQMRLILRRKKITARDDSEQVTKKILKRIFQSQVNIMINISFDFDIQLSMHHISLLKEQVKNPDLIQKVKQTFTSLYRTDTVLYFQAETVALAALDIVLRNQGISVELSGVSQQVLTKVKSQSVRELKQFFLSKLRNQ